MNNHLLSAFTGADNASVDLGRIVWAVATVAYLVFEGVSTFRGDKFDAMTFSSALSALSIAHGVTLRIKGETEPAAK